MIAETLDAIQGWLRARRPEMITFLRELIAIPSHDGEIGPVAAAVGRRLEALGFDEIRYDAMGNLVGRVGTGPRVLLYDSHLDTVAVSDPAAWAWDPYAGKVEDDVVFGLGAGDEKGSTPPMVYALAALKALGLTEGWTFYYFGNIEEWCEGLAARVLVEREGIRPDYVVVGESTNLDVYLGQRGRMEIHGVVRGRASHASAPERGVNAIARALPLLGAIEALGPRLGVDPVLGAATIAVTRVCAAAGSVNVIPDRCEFVVDRRLIRGETPESALAQLRALPEAEGAEFTVPSWTRPSYTGFSLPVPLVFPAWVTNPEHPLVAAGEAAVEYALGRRPCRGRWLFSTNGVYWAGVAGIPTIGLGPGDEATAHTVLDQVPVHQVWDAAEVYAVLPLLLRDAAPSRRGLATSMGDA
ncbi:MAG: YgeY family selenium metabolism-linked hydrolase [Armatimonadota bacterium]|nr:YgeY family selenium metabolism-linked hydrolase [Armatimonadota bacterium]MDR7420909.1 YgeY family selenium metabolism-linked hydrolase [Armatimonadota bacterium]MDR7453647.1 YgeY family selenium metabolism-linked hydrolase [Armatimonadota bacterium]MDR7457143.1 YgeY family selenium metabolism-linked hydrolase [Armatimonadota bacterium]MDR7497116.1 YgeY family selenium metabolism-linked hydrolase [Armatimonadota bacterium]